MSRLLFVVFVFAAVAVAGVLFQVKYKVQQIERELAGINQQIIADQEAAHVLKAEWSFLNQPARIAELAQRHLQLGPMKPIQISSVGILPPRPEDFGYAQAALADALPEPRLRPSVPADWAPGRVQAATTLVVATAPATVPAAPNSAAASVPVVVAAPLPRSTPPAAAQPSPLDEEGMTDLIERALSSPAAEPGARALPISASYGEAQR